MPEPGHRPERPGALTGSGELVRDFNMKLNIFSVACTFFLCGSISELQSQVISLHFRSFLHEFSMESFYQ